MKHLLNGATVLNLGWEWNINEGCGGTCKNNVGTYMDGRSRLASVLGRASAVGLSLPPLAARHAECFPICFPVHFWIIRKVLWVS